MGQKWIIDLIADLRSFAYKNGLPLLARQLDATSTVAQEKLAAMSEGELRGSTVEASQSKRSFGGIRSGHKT